MVGHWRLPRVSVVAVSFPPLSASGKPAAVCARLATAAIVLLNSVLIKDANLADGVVNPVQQIGVNVAASLRQVAKQVFSQRSPRLKPPRATEKTLERFARSPIIPSRWLSVALLLSDFCEKSYLCHPQLDRAL
jgi:hypothetical protein